MSARVAVVGAGRWGKNLVRNFHDLGALHVVCETDPAAWGHLRETYPDLCVTKNLDRFVLRNPNVDAVALATPAATHFRLARQALLAGKDVFVEKPMALDTGHAQELVALAEAKQRILMVGHLLWYHPAVVRLKRLVEQGALGELRYLYSHRLNLGRIRREENALWSFAPHDVSVILGLVGEEPEHVEAHGGEYLQGGVADVTMSHLRFPSGVQAHVFVSWLHPFKEQRLVAVGSEAMAVFNDTLSDGKLVVYRHGVKVNGGPPTVTRAPAEAVPLPSTEPLRAECAHFLECIQTRRTPRTDGREGVRVLSVLQACQERLDGDSGDGGGPEHPMAPMHPLVELCTGDGTGSPRVAVEPEGEIRTRPGLVVFAYDFPHRKTRDVLVRLHLEGWPVAAVLAAPRVELDLPPSVVRTKVRHRTPMHPQRVAESLGMPYHAVPHDSPEALELLDLLGPDLGVIAGARILPREVLGRFGTGILNLHPGLIPQVRGLDALLWSIMDGVPPGVTAHLIDRHVDAGRLLLRRVAKIQEDDTILDLSERLHEIGLDLMGPALELAGWATGEVVDPEAHPNRGKMEPAMQEKAMARWPEYRDRWSAARAIVVSR